MKKELKMVELFSGSGNMARAFENEGYKVLTVDMNQSADIQTMVTI